ncbi:HAD family hydrolase [Fodinibius halophilus]|uniref:HAD family hydrolase n=1 Tax=Fodinibius halophilus TaxID=1736908 RepID=A0A6M1TC21_9BACT|nr:HAD family hydrolase [Fodinibius halophilus]NGP88474.1 HAD family hydrolase [Fodinibius halophilus]
MGTKKIWIEELKRSGIKDLFEVLVFSSDYSFIKPSSKIYQEALSNLRVKDIDKIAFIGDSLTYDMQGASELGLKTIWINEEAFKQNHQHEFVDVIIPDLLYLKKA